MLANWCKINWCTWAKLNGNLFVVLFLLIQITLGVVLENPQLYGQRVMCNLLTISIFFLKKTQLFMRVTIFPSLK